MNQSKDVSPQSPNRLLEALIEEDARLGKRDDALLLAAIDLAIHRRHPSYPVVLSRWQKNRSWLLSAAAVLVISAVSIWGLRVAVFSDSSVRDSGLIVSLLPGEVLPQTAGGGASLPRLPKRTGDPRLALEPIGPENIRLPIPKMESGKSSVNAPEWIADDPSFGKHQTMVEQPEVTSLAGSSSPLAPDLWLSPAQKADAMFPLQAETGSWDRLANHLLSGAPLAPSTVHADELVNAMTYAFPSPEPSEAFSITAEIASCPWEENHRLLMVGIRGQNDSSHVPGDLTIRIRFDAGKVARYRMIGQTVANSDEIQDLARKGGAVRRQMVALYEFAGVEASSFQLPDGEQAVATVLLDYPLPGNPAGRAAISVPVNDNGISWTQSSSDFRTAGSAAWLAAFVRGDRESRVPAARERLSDLSRGLSKSANLPRLVQLEKMVAKVIALP